MFSMCQCSAGSWRQILTKTKLFLTYYSILSVEASFWSPPSLPGGTDICNVACKIEFICCPSAHLVWPLPLPDRLELLVAAVGCALTTPPCPRSLKSCLPRNWIRETN